MNFDSVNFLLSYLSISSGGYLHPTLYITSGPVVQKLAAESQMALVLLKYLPLEAHHLPTVVSSIKKAVDSPLWSSRAAGLLFTQYFWFRQCFLLSTDQLKVLKVRQGVEVEHCCC